MPGKKTRKTGKTGKTKPRAAIILPGTPVDRLTPHKQAYVKSRVEGATIRKASADAGICGRQGWKYEREEDVKEAYRWLMRRVFPMKDAVELVRQGCHATMPVFDSTGKRRRDRPDWRARHPFIKMAIEQAAYAEATPEAGGASFINIVVKHLGSGGPSHVEAADAPTAEATRPQHPPAAQADRAS